MGAPVPSFPCSHAQLLPPPFRPSLWRYAIAPYAGRSAIAAARPQAIVVANVVNHFNYFIYLNWMPTYFHAAMGLNVRASALFTFLPWLAMARTSRRPPLWLHLLSLAAPLSISMACTAD